MRRRLMKEITNLRDILGQSSSSTGVAEGTQVTIVKKIVSEHTTIVESEWRPVKDDASEGANDSKVKSISRLFFKLISTRKKVPGDSETPAKNEQPVNQQALEESAVSGNEKDTSLHSASLIENNMTNEEIKHEVEADFSKNEKSERLENNETQQKMLEKKESETSEKKEIDEAMEELATILHSESTEELEKLLKDFELIMINMIDVGGQPAILEMLPPLTIGPALYFLFFRLDQELNKPYEVKFRSSGSEEGIPIGGYYCTKNVLHQSLSSIACFGCYSQEEQMSSKILLCGTYKDKAEDTHVSAIEEELSKELEKTKFSTEGLLLDASGTDLFFSIDNMNGDEDEMSVIRTSIEGTIEDHFVPIPIPAVWLMLRVVLHLMRKPIVTLSQCRLIFEQLSEQAGTINENSVKDALRFFHRNIGSLMHYDKIPSMQDIVICDPQVIMDSVSVLIFDRFIGSGTKLNREKKDFKKKGQFTYDQIANAKRDAHLNVDQLIDLLKHLNILAEIGTEKENEQVSEKTEEQASKQAPDKQERKQADQSNRRFIMPAVLEFASDNELKNNPKQKYHEHIMVHFSCGFVPFGVFSACMAHLINSSNTEPSRWELSNSSKDMLLWRNKVTFTIDAKFFVILISRLQYIEIQVSGYERVVERDRKAFLDICPVVQQEIIKALRNVISKMKRNPYMMNETSLFSGPLFHLAFPCCLDESHSEHLMKVVITDGELTCTCLQQEGMEVPGPFSPEHLVWFDKVRVQCMGISCNVLSA